MHQQKHVAVASFIGAHARHNDTAMRTVPALAVLELRAAFSTTGSIEAPLL